MIQGVPLSKSAESATLSRKLARRGDTLHILCHVLRHQAQARGDTATVDLINHVFAHVGDGDSVKLYLMRLIEE